MKKYLTPAFRRWAYGVTAAGLAAAAVIGWVPPETAVVLGPLVMAIFYVNDNGEPK